MTKTGRLPLRSRVKQSDTWNLASLYPNDKAWEKDLKSFERKTKGYDDFKGKLATSPATLAKCIRFDSNLDRLGERLGTYAFLKTAEDQSNSASQRMFGRFQNVATRASELASFIRPEIMAIPKAKLRTMLAAKEIRPYKLLLDRILRYAKYTLSKKEESLLAMQGEMAQASRHAFRQLMDADLKFGMIRDESGNQIELSNATFMELLHASKRSVRKSAFHQYYEQFKTHENTLAALLNGSIQTDVYYARARGYESTLHQSLYADNVPLSVYDNLISSVRRHLPSLYRYFDLRRRKMRLRDIHHYDTYVSLLPDLESRRTWSQAVKTIIRALEPLGTDYCGTLEQGLQARWCDRYPNQGKQSGAFSCGSFDGDPYILMNYKPNVLDDMFTLAHEAGHSMHSYYSARSQPYEYYDYTIFVAEVASTFNEQLLSRHLMDKARSDRERAFLINRDIDAIRGTIIRQTMFAEFEKITHEMAEQGEPLTVQAFKDTYLNLLRDYFGDKFALDEQLALEGLRIPHFYRAYYVYKYATGLSAAIALSQRVVQGGKQELNDYLGFLRSGCSKYPLDLLRDAGVDLEQPGPVDTALERFDQLVTELDELL